MFTANEAREKMEQLKKERTEREMKIAEAKVEETLKSERIEIVRECCLGLVISENTEKELKSMGYEVERIFSQQEESDMDTKLKW